MKAAKLVVRLDEQTFVRLWDVARQYGLTPQAYVLKLIHDALGKEFMGGMDPTVERVLSMMMPVLLSDDDDDDGWERRESR